RCGRIDLLGVANQNANTTRYHCDRRRGDLEQGPSAGGRRPSRHSTAQSWPTGPGQRVTQGKEYIEVSFRSTGDRRRTDPYAWFSGEYEMNARSLATAAWVVDQALVVLSWEP